MNLLNTKNTIYLTANWKSNQTITQTKLWLETFRQIYTEPRQNIKSIIFAPYTDITEANQYINAYNLPICMGAQNVSLYSSGAHTGQITAQMLSELVEFCLLGHSEVRKEQSETDISVAEKTKQLLKFSITPVICLDTPYIETQIEALLAKNIDLRHCVFAYEPLSAIGNSHPEDSHKANMVAGKIRFLVHENSIVLYGGSVDKSNIKSFTDKININGVLVGGASLSAQSFMSLISAIS